MNNRGETDILKLVIGIALVALVAGQLGYIDLGKKDVTTTTTAGGTTIPRTGLAPDGVCPIGAVVEDTTVTLDAQDKYVSSTAIDSGSVITYRLNGGAPSILSDGGTLTASPGDMLDVWFAMNTSARGVLGYYAEPLLSQKIPCAGTITYTGKVAPNATIGSTGIKFYNENGDTAPNI